MNKVTLTIFTDPMMGLSYESEPVIRRLETHFGESLEIRYAMCVLVGDVRHFMIPEDMAETPEQTLRNYNRRLASIYRKEEEINGMPIAMEECHLFDMQHLTSEPLCLAVKAVQIIATERAEQFLYQLRYATIVEVRPTTHHDELLRVVRITAGIDETAFQEVYENGMAEKALQHDLCIARSLNLRSLPAYMLHYGNRHILIHDLANFDAFASAIHQLTGGSISPTLPEVTTESLRRLITRHPVISPIEISQAFNLHTAEEVKQFIQPLIDSGEISIQEVPHGLFIKKNNKKENEDII